jgi:hypothetical protein
MKRASWCMAAALSAATLPATLPAQSLATRVSAVRNGTVLMAFPARPGVCGDGGGSVMTYDTRAPHDNRRWACIPGPVRVAIGRVDGQVVSIREWVGGRFTPGASDTNLGVVSAPDAARYLLGLGRAASSRSADDAIAAASFADSVNVAPELTSLVRDTNAPTSSRKQALFWLGQSDAPTADLLRLDHDLSTAPLREQFVFVLSQRHDDAALDKLIEVARHDPDRDTRKRAMFWIGQSRDPRAIKFLRDILTS